MDRNSLAKLLWVEPSSNGLPLCGCYVVDPKIKSYFPEPVAVPLKHIAYDVELLNNLARVRLTQTYVNPLSQLLEVEYSFPLQPNACLFRFSAKFANTLLVGRIKQKEQARQEYQQALQQGLQVAYGQIDDSSKDIINIKIGNLPAGAPCEIVIEYVQELEVSTCTFWKFTAYSTISPRYLNDKPTAAVHLAHYNPHALATTLGPTYTWSFEVKLRSSKPITFYNSPSHQLAHISMSIDKKQAVFELDRTCVPNKDFVLLYSTEKIGEPSYVIGRTDVGLTAALSFIPQFVQPENAYQMAAKGSAVEYDMQTARGQYIFLLDRSGSMSGDRIERAKQALTLFLKSLPQDSYFQVYSFGSSYNTLFTTSNKYGDGSMSQAVAVVNSWSADMGGTEIEQPLAAIFATPVIPGYPKQVFLLTDGDVSNTDQVIKLVRDNTHFARVHTIGVGNGASPALIKGCAQKGKGKHIFIQDDENVSGKVVQLLEVVLSPVLTNFQFKYEPHMVEAVIPNPSQMPYILKDQPFTVYVLFKPGSTGVFDFRISYLNSATNSSFFSNHRVELSGGEEFPYVDKLAHFKALAILSDAIDDKKKLSSDIAVSEVGDLKAYVVQQSVRHQVLCRLTAFICVEQVLVDGRYQEKKSTHPVKVVVPQHTSVDQRLPPPIMFGYGAPMAVTTSCVVPAGIPTSLTTFGGSGMFFGAPSPPPPAMRFGGLFGSPPPIQKRMAVVQTYCAQPQPASQPQRRSPFSAGISTQQTTCGLFGSCVPSRQMGGYGGLGPSSPFESKPTPLETLVSLQKSDGSWGSMDVLQLIKFPQDKFNHLRQQFGQDDLLLTVLVVAYITRNHNQPEYALILKKARSWINKTATARNINQTLIAQAQALIQ